jgi:hypothetical protein
LCAAAVGALTCNQVHAFINVTASDEIRDMPSNYAVPTNAPIQSASATTIANDWADLLDGSIIVSIQAAGVTADNFFWSGEDGSSGGAGAVSATNTCSGWASSAGNPAEGALGYAPHTASTWLNGGGMYCDNAYPILCVCY